MMKRLATMAAAAGLLALAACGSRNESNTALVDNTSDYFNVTSDDLGVGNDLGNASGNAAAGNSASGNAAHAASGNHAAAANGGAGARRH